MCVTSEIEQVPGSLSSSKLWEPWKHVEVAWVTEPPTVPSGTTVDLVTRKMSVC